MGRYSKPALEVVVVTGNADSIDEIREQWKREIKSKRIQIVKELHLFPEGKTPEYVTYGYARVSTRGRL